MQNIFQLPIAIKGQIESSYFSPLRPSNHQHLWAAIGLGDRRVNYFLLAFEKSRLYTSITSSMYVLNPQVISIVYFGFSVLGLNSSQVSLCGF